MRPALPLLLLVWPLFSGLHAQTLAQRVAAVEEGTVRLSFAARAGVCGDQADHVTIRHDTDEWQADCERRPVRVALRVRDHRVHSVRTYVGGQWLPDRWSKDLGTVSARQAADYIANNTQPHINTAHALEKMLRPVLIAAGVKHPVFRFRLGEKLTLE